MTKRLNQIGCNLFRELMGDMTVTYSNYFFPKEFLNSTDNVGLFNLQKYKNVRSG